MSLELGIDLLKMLDERGFGLSSLGLKLLDELICLVEEPVLFHQGFSLLTGSGLEGDHSRAHSKVMMITIFCIISL